MAWRMSQVKILSLLLNKNPRNRLGDCHQKIGPQSLLQYKSNDHHHHAFSVVVLSKRPYFHQTLDSHNQATIEALKSAPCWSTRGLQIDLKSLVAYPIRY